MDTFYCRVFDECFFQRFVVVGCSHNFTYDENCGTGKWEKYIETKNGIFLRTLKMMEFLLRYSAIHGGTL